MALHEQPCSISDLYATIVHYYEKVDYKATYNQVKLLEKNGYVNLEQKKKEQGKPVIASLTEKGKQEYVALKKLILDTKNKG